MGDLFEYMSRRFFRGDRKTPFVLLGKVCLVAWLCGTSASQFGCTGGGGGGGGGGGAGADGDGFDSFDDGTPANQIAREIEEADIVKQVGGLFYLANRYKGFRIIDATNVSQARMAGGVSMGGRGVELFVDDQRAFVVSSADFFSCGSEPVSFDDMSLADSALNPDYSGSRITVIDISDPDAPFEISHFDLDGFITATRRVGDVIYAAGDFTGFAQNDDDGDQPPDGDGGDSLVPPPPASTGIAVTVGANGDATASTESPAGVRAEVSITGGVPGAFVQITVVDGNMRGDTNGILDGTVLPISLSFITDLTPGEFQAAINVSIHSNQLEDAGLTGEQLAFYARPETGGYWLAPATNYSGMSDPTDTVGDFGYREVGEDGDVEAWAVVDALPDMIVGRRFAPSVLVSTIDALGGQVVLDPQLGPQFDSYDYGATVSVTAVAEDGFAFVGWASQPVTSNGSGASFTFVAATDASIEPIFEQRSPEDFGPRVFIVSLNIADPNDIRLVDRVDVTGDSLDIHVTPEAMYILGEDPTMSGTTRVTYIDISDPGGDVRERDTFRVPGIIENRFFVDEYQGVFRVVTEDRSAVGTEVVVLYLYDITNPDVVERTGDLVIKLGESLRSVRFDGERGYAVTFLQIDPLFVLDLSNPNKPVIAGELEVPGWSTFLFPLQDRLVGVGFDDQAGFRPAVALYDVSDPGNPRQLSRIVLGDSWTFDANSAATTDEKAIKILEDQDLILMPYSAFDETRGRFVDSLQLIDLLPQSLRERGFIEHDGLVRRAGMLSERLWLLSDESFQVADMTSRDDVASVVGVAIMSEQELLDAGLGDCVDSVRFEGFELPPGAFFFGDGFSDIVIGTPVGPCGMMGMAGMPLAMFALLGLRFISRSKR